MTATITGPLEIVAEELPLPVGASTEATLAGVAIQLSGLAVQLTAILTQLSAGPVKVKGFGPSDTVSVSGTVTISGNANATNQLAGNAALGAPADAAYSGTGNGSIISILKAMLNESGPIALTDRSGTIAAAGVAQPACAANPSRKFLLISNPDEGEDLYVNFATTVTLGTGIRLGPGLGLILDNQVPNGAVSVAGPVVGQAFTVQEG